MIELIGWGSSVVLLLSLLRCRLVRGLMGAHALNFNYRFRLTRQ
jgi:hypothetical protein